jgi:hypothetical protein
MVKTINVTMDDADAAFVRDVKESMGITWKDFMIQAAASLNGDPPDGSMDSGGDDHRADVTPHVATYDTADVDAGDTDAPDGPSPQADDGSPSNGPTSPVGGLADDTPRWGPDIDQSDIQMLEDRIAGGGIELQRRVDAVITMWDHLREAGKADKSAMMDAAADEIAATSYDSPDSFYSNVIKGTDTLADLPGVHKPMSGMTMWEYIDP